MADTRTTLIDVLLSHAEHTPDRKAYEFVTGGAGRSLTYARLERRVRAVATALREHTVPGDRVLVMCSPGLDYVAALLGVLYTGAIAVPAYPPTNARSMSRLINVVRDAGPVAVLADTPVLDLVRLHDTEGFLSGLHKIAVEELPDSVAGGEGPATTQEGVALLQYTSGSTGRPKGVKVSHRNLTHNSAVIAERMSTSPDSVCVSWLPPYHDMGLVGGVLQPLHGGFLGVLMTPLDFLQRPIGWLEVVSDYGATVSGGPDFAFELCSARYDREPRDDLDLSGWSVAFSGSEPVRQRTLDRFAERFSSCGFRERAFYPCYGLAEATLLVSGGPVEADPLASRSPEQQESEPAETVWAGEGPFVGCGGIPSELDVRIADPSTGEPVVPGAVGEVLVAGDSVALGYWNNVEEESFTARLPGSDQEFLRTGDLGFITDGQLFITSRLKDVLILRGRNYHPHDIEDSAARSHPLVRTGAVAAFTAHIGEQERLVVVAEVRDGATAEQLSALTREVRRAVAEENGLSVHAVVPIRARTAPKTANGKLRRHQCRELFLTGGLGEVSATELDKESI